MVRFLSKLHNLPVTVQHLQDTGVGRTVNALRKYEGDTGEAAKALVAKWKAMVAAEDLSDGEEQPEAENNNSPDEARHVQRHDERHRSNKEKISQQQQRSDCEKWEDKKGVKVKEMHSQGEVRKRKQEEENKKKTEKRRRKDHVHSESPGDENSVQVVEQDSDSGHESEVRVTSRVNQSMEGASSNNGLRSPRGSVCVQDRDQGHGSKLHISHQKHEKHKSRSCLNKEKEHSSRDKGRISSSHEGKNKTENKGVESKPRKGEKRKMEVTVDREQRCHNNSKKHKSKTESHGNNITNVSKLSSSVIHRDKTSVKIKKGKLSGEEEEDGSIDCSTGMYLTCLDIIIVSQVFCSHSQLS
jgi:transcription elongation factor B polypeptide 3